MANVESLPTKTVNKEELERIASKAKKINVWLAVVSVCCSVAGSAAVAGFTWGKAQSTLEELEKRERDLILAVNGMRDSAALFSASFAAYRVEIDNLKEEVRREHAERVEAERRFFNYGGR
jgi:hypothetical protein